MVKRPSEVEGFLAQVKQLIQDDKMRVNNKPWRDKVNKTLAYMAETNISRNDIRTVVNDLSVENYCATKPDANSNFPNEEIWEFGITKEMVDKEVDLYIKLKIKKIQDDYLLVMSFHPEQPDSPEKKLQFPYKTE